MTAYTVHEDRHYKWVALSNTTLGLLMATINSSIVLIALPDIFRGIGIDPLAPGNTSYLLWMIMGFLVVTAVLVVGLGRLGDMYGRVRMYNLGFLIFTVSSVLLAVTWMHGDAAALWLIGWRIVQGVGGALPDGQLQRDPHRRVPGATSAALALGINGVAAIAGSFLGLVIGGLLGPAQLAPGVPRVRAVRRVRHGLGVPQAARHRRAARRPGWTGGATSPSPSA